MIDLFKKSLKVFTLPKLWDKSLEFSVDLTETSTGIESYYIRGGNCDWVYFACSAFNEVNENYLFNLQEHLLGYSFRETHNAFPMCKTRADAKKLFIEISKQYLTHIYDSGSYINQYNVRLNGRLFSKTLARHLMKIGCNLSIKLLSLGTSKKFNVNSTKNVTIKIDGSMTYCPKGKRGSSINGRTWVSKGRQSSKYGKLIYKIILENDIKDVSSAEIERLSNSLKALLFPSGDFKIVEGEDITKYYHYDSYADGNTGSLGESCMRHDECSSFFELYEDIAKMLILVNKDDKILGRALIWKVEKDIYMDRIYGSDYIISKFCQYAKKNGWYHKEKQSYDKKTTWIDPKDGLVKKILLKIYIPEKYYEYYPYVDTFSFMLKDKYITNDRSQRWDCLLEDTDGSWVEGDDNVECEFSGEYYHEDDTIYIEDSIFSGRVYENYAQWCSYTQEYHLERDMVELERRPDYCFRDASCVIQAGCGNLYHEDDVKYCDYNNEYYPEEEVEYIEELEMDVHSDDIDDAYKESGWVQNDDSGQWEQVI